MPRSNTLDLDKLVLLRGAHDNRSKGVCLLEAAAWLAGKPHTDHPPCVSPILGAYGRSFNDRLDDERRQQLKPFIPRLLNTASDGKDERRREILWEFVVPRLIKHLRAAGLEAEAVKVETAARSSIREVREAAWRARWAARDHLKAAIQAELVKRGRLDAVAAAAAAADADAAAAAAAAADAVAVAAADAAAAAVAVAAAVADAVAVAVAEPWGVRWQAAYNAARPIFDAKYKAIADEFTADGFELFDRLIDAQVS